MAHSCTKRRRTKHRNRLRFVEGCDESVPKGIDEMKGLPFMVANFVVTGMTFNPHECTAHFGVQPTKVLIKGDRLSGIKTPVPHSSWSIQPKKLQLDSTDVAVQHLLTCIWPHRKAIRSFAMAKGLRATFVLKITGGLGKRNFLYEFSPRTI